MRRGIQDDNMYTDALAPAEQERLRELGGEFGTVTGRERRCGWLDLVALRYAMRLNGFTSLALTKVDVLSAFEEIPVCVRYVLPDGTETPNFPAHQSDFHRCRPVFETLAGWRRLEYISPNSGCLVRIDARVLYESPCLKPLRLPTRNSPDRPK